MALTVTTCKPWIRLSLGGALPGDFPLLVACNMAGRFLCQMTAWRFLENAETLLSTVISTNYIVLPANFGQVISLRGTTDNADVEWVGREQMNDLRAGTSSGTDGFVYAVIETAAQSGITPPTKRLAIHPTPTASTSNLYRLVYRAEWAELTADEDEIPLPYFVETLYLRILQEHAEGFVRKEQGSLEQRLAAIAAGPVFRAAMARDKTAQPDIGRIVGAIEQRRARFPLPWTGTIGDP